MVTGRLQSSGLYHMSARKMNPALGVFTAPDPSDASDAERPQTLNRFAYANNSPTNLIDPTGYAATEAAPAPPAVDPSTAARSLLDAADNQAGVIQKSNFKTYEEADVWAQNYWNPVSAAAKDEAQWMILEVAKGDFAVTYPTSALRSTGNPEHVDVRGQLRFLVGHKLAGEIRGSGNTHPFNDFEFSGHDGSFLESFSAAFKKSGADTSRFMLSLANQKGQYRTVESRDLRMYKSSTGNYLQQFPGTLRSGVKISTEFDQTNYP
ncbi:MAG: RHS repeat-associated core domain-containing protein [Gammaproteobacteria bacterium]